MQMSNDMRQNIKSDSKSRSDESIYLTVVIPVFNEVNRIGKTLEKIMLYLDPCNYSFEIIVVDDGSTDGTYLLVKEFSERYKEVQILRTEMNQGKGDSVRKGMLASRGQYAVFSDADLSTPIEEIEKLLEWLGKGYDIAIGSRGLRESDIKIHQPWYREAMGKTFNLLVRFLAVKGIKDTQCGFKCFKQEIVQDVFDKQTISHFSFDVELLWIALKRGYKIKEVPVIWWNDVYSKVNPVSDSLRMFYDLMKIKINDLRGLYD